MTVLGVWKPDFHSYTHPWIDASTVNTGIKVSGHVGIMVIVAGDRASGNSAKIQLYYFGGLVNASYLTKVSESGSINYGGDISAEITNGNIYITATSSTARAFILYY